MKNKLVTYIGGVLVLFSSVLASAHCPYEFASDSKAYCLDVEWVNGQTKAKDVFKDSKEPSPVLNLSKTSRRRWVYSQANVYVWEKNKGHDPVYIQDLKVFPYMVMPNGHSHGASSAFSYDVDNKHYVLSEMAFQEMNEGCWQMRMSTTDSAEDIVLFNITEFKNIAAEANYVQSVMCSLCAAEPSGPSNDAHDHSNHSHH